MNGNLQTVLNKIDALQKKHKQGSAQWCVGEQLKDILRADPAGAGIVEQDLEQEGMGLADCEKKIAEFARKHSEGGVGFCGPADSDLIIRQFYGLPERGAAPVPTSPAGGTGRRTIRLTDFL